MPLIRAFWPPPLWPYLGLFAGSWVVLFDQAGSATSSGSRCVLTRLLKYGTYFTIPKGSRMLYGIHIGPEGCGRVPHFQDHIYTMQLPRASGIWHMGATPNPSLNPLQSLRFILRVWQHSRVAVYNFNPKAQKSPNVLYNIAAGPKNLKI